MVVKKYKILAITFIVMLSLSFLILQDGKADSIDENTYIFKTSINKEVTQDIKENLISISFVDLSFALDELLKELHEYPSMRKIWINRVENYFEDSNPIFYLIADKEISFFYEALEKRYDLMSQYPDEVIFLKKNTVDTKGRKYLSANEYNDKLKIFNGKNDNFLELSRFYYDLLTIDGLNFVNEIKKDKKALEAYRLWIKNIEHNEFESYSVPEDTEIIKRRRNFLLKEYKNCQDPLILEAMKYIMNAKIQK
jgi:hypothetical protein